MKLPPRRVLRSIVQDAISDREEYGDPSVADKTRETLERYRKLLPRLEDAAPPLREDDRDLLAMACMHARIWREGYLEAWAHTGEKAVILAARQDVERVTRTEDALGVVRHWLNGGPQPEGISMVTIAELSKRAQAEGWTSVEFGSGHPFAAA